MTPSRPAQAIYLPGRHGPVFAMLHAAGAPGATAVLLCPPFGWDDMCSYRARREWAESLAGTGHDTLRLDLPGTGDSPGGPSEEGLVDAWTEAIEDAGRWLLRETGAERLAAIGIGVGGLLACRAALRGAPFERLVLWSVPAQGRRLMRELSTFATPGAARAGSAPTGAPDGNGEGSLMINGYLLSGESAQALGNIDLAGESSARSPVRRALLLGRDGIRVDEALGGLLRDAGVEVATADGPGYGAMMLEPQEARAPREVFTLVGSWLQRADRSDAGASPPAVHGIPLRACAGGGALTDLICNEDGFRERPITLQGPTGALFGILTEPLRDRQPLTALLLNAGPQRRTGPNRMWVEIARRWAARGVSTLRLDAAGIGDSDGDASALARIAEFYRPDYAEQVRSALADLADRGLPPRFLLLGLCAGSYWAAQAALSDERVSGMIMLNPRTLVYDKRASTARRVRELRQRALLASTWRKALHGELRLSRHLETTRTLVELAAGAPARRRARLGTSTRSGGDQVEQLFDALRERGQRATLMFTGAEILHEELLRRGSMTRLHEWPNLEIAVLGNEVETHTLSPPWLQRQVHELVDRVLLDELARALRAT